MKKKMVTAVIVLFICVAVYLNWNTVNTGSEVKIPDGIFGQSSLAIKNENSDAESEQTEKTEAFIARLKEKTDIKVVTQDERFSTMQALRLLLEADMRREKRKDVIDKIAASYILEDYLRKMKIQGDKK